MRAATPSTSPLARGTALAVAAAVLFGVTSPLVQRAGAATGPFTTAALLYGGAMIATSLSASRSREAAVRREHAGRIAIVALFGAAIAPVCLAWGLQRTSAVSASLLLNAEAVLTVVLARALYKESVSRRVVLACGLMLAGGAMLALRARAVADASSLAGMAAVAVATFAWAVDNSLTRPLADLDPRAVVRWKALAGATLSSLGALLAREVLPDLGAALALLALGAFGYGVSLRLYLLAQRVLGAGRTGSLFAVGPFVGAALAFALGDRGSPGLVAAAGGVFGVAVWLHATEDHGHHHRHERITHEHAHVHDDGHHGHVHAVAVVGSHSHEHTHEPVEHEHPHGEDVHHRHRHE
jgi:drug/metabolite transporter (DMT)-like permease